MLALGNVVLRRRTIGALAAVLVFTLAGTAVAGSGRYGNVQLGITNSITGYTTTIGASVAGNALQVLNASTATAARALLARNAGAAGAIAAQNVGPGPAANFIVSTSRSPRAAPFTVNSSTKVVALNADKLDGLDSTNFQRTGAGGTDTAKAGTLAFGASIDLAVAGGTLAYYCFDTYAAWGWNGPVAEIWWDTGAADPGHASTTGVSSGLANAGDRYSFVFSTATRVAFVDLYSHHTSSDCHYALQASEYQH
jgi:hypothetical protein